MSFLKSKTVTIDVEITFEEACQHVLRNIKTRQSDGLNLIIDTITRRISFDELCRMVLDQMDKEEPTNNFEELSDRIIKEWDDRKRIPIVDLMKQEVLEKIKQEISLEKIEEFYEENTKSKR